FPPQALCVQTWVTGHDSGRVSPFGHPRITAFLAAPRGFSQPDASFIGSWRLGIHREPLITWPVIDARARYRVLKVLEVARTPRTEQCARPAPPPLALSTPFRVSTQAVERSRRPSSQCIDLVLCGLRRGDKPRPTGRLPKLLRKEVIQPHLPVRLPCYDFTPIADPTFDGSLLTVGPPASGVTDFRGVTGGVYKARERIHRSIADLRLLATPTSRGRVADPDPN